MSGDGGGGGDDGGCSNRMELGVEAKAEIWSTSQDSEHGGGVVDGWALSCVDWFAAAINVSSKNISNEFLRGIRRPAAQLISYYEKPLKK